MSRDPRRRVTARHLLLAAAVLVTAPAVALGAVGAGLASLPAAAAPSPLAISDIPVVLLTVYQRAAATCPGLAWPVLAAVGKVETNHNRPANQVSAAGAQGPMQFLPSTWAQYGLDANADGRVDPLDPADAVPSAARYLCALAADHSLPLAIAGYLCGDLADCRQRAQQPGGYTTRVLHWAERYTDTAPAAGPAATAAVQAALAELGTPYLWGGETAGVGFDCSGLVHHAYATTGLALPRTAQGQYDAGPQLPAGMSPQPGDLVFFGADSSRVTHVGIALGDGRMVDAPHTGALVRVEPIAGFGHYLGATRPRTGAAT
jgi:cell wall-associated NlpC family hydrolase